jgi:TRAP-type uncharacterized transport system substrate-binding protein
MRRQGRLSVAVLIVLAGVLVVASLAPFLAPGLSYQIRNRAAELLSGNRGKTFRIALGSTNGSYYLLGKILNRHLKAKAGYELELVATAGPPENVGALMDPTRNIDLATIDSSSDEAARADGLRALAAIERPYFFVMVPNDSAVREIRDLAGRVNTGARSPGQAPTLGELVLDYYGLIPPLSSQPEVPSAVAVVRPTGRSLLQDFDSGHMAAATRTQFLSAGLIDDVLNSGRYRLVPIQDHEAIARAIPGTEPGFIPAGAYGPGRRIPPAPVPTLVLTSLLVSRSDLPARVVEDLLDVLYDPRFGRDIQHELTEKEGGMVGQLTLHPAASMYYHRNDLVTSDRIGRLSFVASAAAAIFATVQFVLAFRRNERRKSRRKLLAADLERLRRLRVGIAEAPARAEANMLIAEADDLLWKAEQEAAEDRLDHDGIETLRSLHAICWRALRHRTESEQNTTSPSSVSAEAPPVSPEPSRADAVELPGQAEDR